MKLPLILAATLVATSLTACRDDIATVPPVDAKALEQARALTSDNAWLNQHLPADTTAYLRLPSLWGSLAAPNNRPMDAIRAHPAHLKAISSIRNALAKEPLLKQIGLPALFELYLNKLASPLEVALISPNNIAGPASQALFSARLNLNKTEFAAYLAQLVSEQEFELKQPLDAEGFAELKLDKLQASLHFNETTGRLQLLLGLVANKGLLQQLESQPSAVIPAFSQAESRVDDSGQGGFFWLNIASVRALIGLGMTLDKTAATSAMQRALQDWQAVALGWGSQQQHGQMSLWIDAPNAQFLSYLPHSPKTLSLKTVGEPDWLVQLSLPSADEFRGLEQAIQRDFGAEPQALWLKQLQQFEAATSVAAPSLFKALGPELLAFADQAGQFSAVRLADPQLFNESIRKLSQKQGWQLEELRRNGQTYHHLSIEQPKQTLVNSLLEPKQQLGLQLLQRFKGHYYWLQEEDYLIFASVPQSLRDRLNSRERTAISASLKQQGLSTEHSLLAATFKANNLQRDFYYAYLSGLNLLADLSGQPLDLLSLPSAKELQLNPESTMAVRLDASNQGLSFNLSYNETPLELMSGNSMFTVATAGVLASLAIPAYQDYQTRHQVQQSLNQLQTAKTVIAEYIQRQKDLPVDAVAAGLTADELSAPYLEQVKVQHGVLELTFGNQASTGLRGQTLSLKPYVTQDNHIGWLCGDAAMPEGGQALLDDEVEVADTLADKYRPQSCR